MTARRAPLWRLLAVAAAGAALVPATGPLLDVDVYWHVRLGDWILAHHRTPTHELWDFPAIGRHWVPHSWLSEVVLALAHRAAGWNGVIVLRLLVSALLLALMARAVLRHSGPVAGPVVYAVTALALSPALVGRPQLFALVLLAALLPLVERARLGTAPHLLAAAGLGWLWASLHGSWPALPVLFVLAAICAAVEARPYGRLLAAAAACVAGAALTPVGPALLARPYVVARAAHHIREWQPTVLWHPYGLAYGLLLGLLVVAWARGRGVGTADLLWGGALAVGGLVAWRTIAFAAVVLAPEIAGRLTAREPRPASDVPAWTVWAFGAVSAAALVALTVASPTLPDDAPTAPLALLRAQPGEVRVLDDYDVGGFVTGLGGPRVSAAVDGRVDAFPPGYVDDYLAALDLQGDWESVVDDLHATHALLATDRPLAHVLVAERGWREIGHDDHWVVLAVP